MRDKVKGRGMNCGRTPTGYTYLRLQTQPLTPKPCSTEQRGTGGPWPGSACGLDPSGRKEEVTGEGAPPSFTLAKEREVTGCTGVGGTISETRSPPNSSLPWSNSTPVPGRKK